MPIGRLRHDVGPPSTASVSFHRLPDRIILRQSLALRMYIFCIYFHLCSPIGAAFFCFYLFYALNGLFPDGQKSCSGVRGKNTVLSLQKTRNRSFCIPLTAFSAGMCIPAERSLAPSEQSLAPLRLFSA